MYIALLVAPYDVQWHRRCGSSRQSYILELQAPPPPASPEIRDDLLQHICPFTGAIVICLLTSYTMRRFGISLIIYIYLCLGSISHGPGLCSPDTPKALARVMVHRMCCMHYSVSVISIPEQFNRRAVRTSPMPRITICDRTPAKIAAAAAHARDLLVPGRVGTRGRTRQAGRGKDRPS